MPTIRIQIAIISRRQFIQIDRWYRSSSASSSIYSICSFIIRVSNSWLFDDSGVVWCLWVFFFFTRRGGNWGRLGHPRFVLPTFSSCSKKWLCAIVSLFFSWVKVKVNPPEVGFILFFTPLFEIVFTRSLICVVSALQLEWRYFLVFFNFATGFVFLRLLGYIQYATCKP